jgi:hypothetical protein
MLDVLIPQLTSVDTSLASCCDGPDCQPPPYGTGTAWWGLQNGDAHAPGRRG